jgi:hypothetical protein
MNLTCIILILLCCDIVILCFKNIIFKTILEGRFIYIGISILNHIFVILFIQMTLVHLKRSEFIISLANIVLFNWNSRASYPWHWLFPLIKKGASQCVLLNWLGTLCIFILSRSCTCCKYRVFKFLLSNLCCCSPSSFFVHVILTYNILLFFSTEIFLKSYWTISCVSICWKWSFEKIILSFRF